MNDQSIEQLRDELTKLIMTRTDDARFHQLITQAFNDTGVFQILRRLESGAIKTSQLLQGRASEIFRNLKYEQVTTDALDAYEKSLAEWQDKIVTRLHASDTLYSSIAQRLQKQLESLSNVIRDYHTTANILLEKASNQVHSLSGSLLQTTSNVNAQLDHTKQVLESMYSLPERISSLISDLLVTISGIQNAAAQGGSVIAAATSLSGRIAEATSVTKQLSSIADPLVVALDKAAHEAEALSTNLGSWQAALLQNLPSNPGLAEALVALGNQLISVLQSGNNIAKLKAVADTAKSVTDAAVNVKELTSKDETYASF